MKKSIVLLLIFVWPVLSACGGTVAPGAAANPASNVQPATSTAGNPSSAPAAGNLQLPAWWPADLPLPAGTTLEPISGMFVIHQDAKQLESAMTGVGNSAGYATWRHNLLAPDQYRLYFVKGGKAFNLDILGNPSDKIATLGLGQNGLAHVKFSGPASAELDLPIESGQADAGKHNFYLSVAVDKPGCDTCEYDLNIQSSQTIDAQNPEKGRYNGAGDYANFTIQLNPGLAQPTAATGSIFRSETCGLTAKDDLSGTFSCKGLAAGFMNESKDIYDVSGSYRLLADAKAASSATTPVAQAPQPTAAVTSNPTSAPKPKSTPAPANETAADQSDCNIITQADASAVFGDSADQRLNEVAATDQVDFSSTPLSAIESDCSYVVGASGVRYTVYRPDQSTPTEMAKAWADEQQADPSSIQRVEGLGDDAYTRNGELFVKKSSHYLALQVEIPEIHQSGGTGEQKQLAMEKALALKAVSRLP